MKGKIIPVILACVLISQTAFAQTEDSSEESIANLYQTYTQVFPGDTSDNELLTLDEALERAVKNSSSSKTLASSPDLIEKQWEFYGESYSGSYSYSNLVNLLNSQNNYKSTRISKKAAEEEVKYSTKQTYASIILAEREIAIQEQSLKTEEKQLVIDRRKNNLGLLSDESLKQSELSYQKSKEELNTTKEELELLYKSLNVLIGVDENTRYSFEMPVTYEILELPNSIESYIDTKIPLAASVQISEIELNSAQENYNIRGLNEDSTEVYSYDSLVNNLNSADLSLKDQKDSVREEMRTLYNTIKSEESTINLNMTELEDMKESYNISLQKYNEGTISELELMQAERDMAQMEYSILESLYNHMLDVEKFNNMDLF